MTEGRGIHDFAMADRDRPIALPNRPRSVWPKTELLGPPRSPREEIREGGRRALFGPNQHDRSEGQTKTRGHSMGNGMRFKTWTTHKCSARPLRTSDVCQRRGVACIASQPSERLIRLFFVLSCGEFEAPFLLMFTFNQSRLFHRSMSPSLPSLPPSPPPPR